MIDFSKMGGAVLRQLPPETAHRIVLKILRSMTLFARSRKPDELFENRFFVGKKITFFLNEDVIDH